MTAKTKSGPPDGGSAHGIAVGRAVQVSRTAQGLSRAQLAERTGLSYPYVSEIETGKKTGSSKALLAIAEALGMRPHDLLRLADDLEKDASADSTQPDREQRPVTRGSSWFRGPGPSLADSSEPPLLYPLSSMKPEPPHHAGHARLRLHDLVEHLSPEDLDLALQLLHRLTSR